MIEPIKINYDWSIFLNADYTQHSGSCISHQVYELTDIHDQYGGFPETYTKHNTTIHQLWWDKNQIDFSSLENQLGMEIITVSSICQPPGNIIPLHRDTFYQIGQRYPERKELTVRANIFLENYKMGHFIQYQQDSKWTTSHQWLQGQGFIWDRSILHLSANAGFENKYTLQVSGFLL